jgi:hypothetical protein
LLVVVLKTPPPPPPGAWAPGALTRGCAPSLFAVEANLASVDVVMLEYLSSIHCVADTVVPCVEAEVPFPDAVYLDTVAPSMAAAAASGASPAPTLGSPAPTLAPSAAVAGQTVPTWVTEYDFVDNAMYTNDCSCTNNCGVR